MKDTTNRRARSGECVFHSSCCGENRRLADLVAQFVAGLDRDRAESYISDRIDYRVGRLADKFNLDESVQDDLTQDLLLMLVKAMPRYDARRAGWKTFICRVLNRRYRHILRGLMAAENGAPATMTFGCFGFGDGCKESPVDPATMHDAAAAADLRMDVESAVASLPERLGVIARLLMVHSPSAAARIMGVSPAAITRAIARIRAHFRKSGLEGL